MKDFKSVALKLKANPDYDVIAKELGGNIGNFVFGRYVLSDTDFIHRYQNRFNKKPLQFSSSCYDAIKVMSYIIRQKGPSFDAVNDGFKSLKGYQGVTGPFEFDSNGDRYGQKVQIFKLPIAVKD